MSEKHKNICIHLNYFEDSLFFFIFVVSGCVSISAFASLVGFPVVIASSALGIKICAIIAGIKKYESIIKKKRKKHEKLVLLGKAKLDTIEVLISKGLINLYNSHDEFVSVNNVLRKHNEIKEIKNPQNAVEYTVQKRW